MSLSGTRALTAGSHCDGDDETDGAGSCGSGKGQGQPRRTQSDARRITRASSVPDAFAAPERSVLWLVRRAVRCASPRPARRARAFRDRTRVRPGGPCAGPAAEVRPSKAVPQGGSPGAVSCSSPASRRTLDVLRRLRCSSVRGRPAPPERPPAELGTNRSVVMPTVLRKRSNMAAPRRSGPSGSAVQPTVGVQVQLGEVGLGWPPLDGAPPVGAGHDVADRGAVGDPGDAALEPLVEQARISARSFARATRTSPGRPADRAVRSARASARLASPNAGA